MQERIQLHYKAHSCEAELKTIREITFEFLQSHVSQEIFFSRSFAGSKAPQNKEPLFIEPDMEIQKYWRNNIHNTIVCWQKSFLSQPQKPVLFQNTEIAFLFFNSYIIHFNRKNFLTRKY